MAEANNRLPAMMLLDLLRELSHSFRVVSRKGLAGVSCLRTSKARSRFHPMQTVVRRIDLREVRESVSWRGQNISGGSVGLGQPTLDAKRDVERVGCRTGGLDDAQIRRHHNFRYGCVQVDGGVVVFADGLRQVVGGLLGLTMAKSAQGRVGGQTTKPLRRRCPMIVGIVETVLREGMNTQ